MQVQKLIELIGGEFYTGVPDSQLRALCDYLMAAYGEDPKRHIIAANEGNAAAIGARPDLGRPTTTPQENKNAFMINLSR